MSSEAAYAQLSRVKLLDAVPLVPAFLAVPLTSTRWAVTSQTVHWNA